MKNAHIFARGVRAVQCSVALTACAGGCCVFECAKHFPRWALSECVDAIKFDAARSLKRSGCLGCLCTTQNVHDAKCVCLRPQEAHRGEVTSWTNAVRDGQHANHELDLARV
jgi:hypothetical protein